MERIPLTPPIIAPLSPGTQRPKLSVMIPVYNCTEYLEQSLSCILQQDLGESVMQIEVIDDYSTDGNVAALVALLGKGRVQYYRQPQNMGSLRNFETCINRARGHYVHIMHGDDLLKPGFYQKMLALIDMFPEAGAAFCAFDMMKEDGSTLGSSDKAADVACILPNWLHRLAERPWLQYACIIVKRSVYEHLGSFYMATYGEDWEMWVRIAKHYPFAYLPEPLAIYRVHAESITRQSVLTGGNVKDMGRIINQIVTYLPQQDQATVGEKARRYYAHYSLNICPSLWFRSGNKQAVLAQVREALNLHNDKHTRYKAYRIKLLMMLPKSWLPAIRRVIRGKQATTKVEGV